MTYAALLTLYVITGAVFLMYLMRKPPLMLPVMKSLFILTAAFHLFTFASRWADLGLPPASTPMDTVNLLVLFSMLAIAPLVLRNRTAVLGAFLLPVAAMAMAFAAPCFASDAQRLSAAHRLWFTLHTLSVIAGEALLVTAAAASAAFLVHDYVIRRGDLHTNISDLPPLILLDRVITFCLVAGFVSITAGMILGGLWAGSVGIPLRSLIPKIAAGALLWLVLAIGLHQRLAIGWKGRRTAAIVLCCTLLMMVLFLIVNLLYPHAHGIRLI